MSVEIPPNIQTEIDDTYEPNKTGQILLNVYLGKVISAELKQHIKAEPEGMREHGQVEQQNLLDFHQSTP